MMEGEIDKEKFTVQIQNMSVNDAPVLITQSEFMRRMKEQQQLSYEVVACKCLVLCLKATI